MGAKANNLDHAHICFYKKESGWGVSKGSVGTVISSRNSTPVSLSTEDSFVYLHGGENMVLLSLVTVGSSLDFTDS